MEKKTAESVVTHIVDAFKRDGFESVERSDSGVITNVTATVGDVELNLKLNAPSDFIIARTNSKFEGADDVQLSEKAGEIRDAVSADKKSGITVSHYDDLLIVSSSFGLAEDAGARDIFDEIMAAFEYILSFASIPSKVKNAFRKQGKDPYGYEQPEKKPEKKAEKKAEKADQKNAEAKPKAQEKAKGSQVNPVKAAPEVKSAPQPEPASDPDDDGDFDFMFSDEDDGEDLFADNFGGEKEEMKKPEMQPEQNYKETAEVENELDALLAELGMGDGAPQQAAQPAPVRNAVPPKQKKHSSAVHMQPQPAYGNAPQSYSSSHEISRQKMEMYDEIDEIFARKRKESDERESRLDDFSERLKRREQNLEKRISEFDQKCAKKIADAQSEADRIITKAKKIEDEAKLKEKTAEIRMKQAEETQATADRSLKNAKEEKDLIERDKKYCIEKEDAEKIVSENDRLKRQIEEKDDTIAALRSGAPSASSADTEKFRQAISLLMEEKAKLVAENKSLRAGAVSAPDAKTQALLRAANNTIKDLKSKLAKASSAATSSAAPSVMSIDDVRSAVEASGIAIADSSVEGDEKEPVYVAKTDTGILIAVNASVRVIYVKVTPKRIGLLKKKLEDLNNGDVRVSYAVIEKDVVAKYAFTDRESLISGLTEVIDETKAMQ